MEEEDRRELGKIEKIDFRLCDARGVGDIPITFGGLGWGVQGTIFHYTGEVEPGKHKEAAWDALVSLIKEAKKTCLAGLKGVPVEVTFDAARRIKSFRVLEEVL